MARPEAQAAIWLAGAVLYACILTIYYGARPDIARMISNPVFILELLSLLALTVLSGIEALHLSRPDRHQNYWLRYALFGLGAVGAVFAYLGGSELGLSDAFKATSFTHFDCLLDIALISIPPGLALFVLINKGTPIHCCWAGGTATIAAASLGYFCMRIIEQNDDLAHLLVWHAFPIALACFVGIALGRLTLRWR
jgi:hypothetical protein